MAMLTSFPICIVVGVALGFLSGLGIGGGSLLILWLTILAHVEPQTARGINLLFFLPSALGACFPRIVSGKLRIRPLLPAMLAGCVAAGIFSYWSQTMDTVLLKKLFGLVLLCVGVRELFWKNANKKHDSF